jgi:HNH endonuclease
MGKQRRSGNRKSKPKGSLETRVNSSGYQQFKDPSTGRWELTHKRVAEKLVGGSIFPGREVHHIDGDKTNNRPSNLTIVSKAKHRVIHRTK